MIVIPAVDIRKGYCIRLTQGKLDRETVFSTDPVFMAKLWRAQGAGRLHVIDMDGAFTGESQNLSIIEKITESVDIPVQMGGGIRRMEKIEEILEKGIDRVILGTSAVYEISLVRKAVRKFGEKIIVSIDAIEDKVAIGGWKDITSVKPDELAGKMEDIGVKEIIFTSIGKDGMMEGPDMKSIEGFADRVKVPVIVSGGISSIEDIARIKALGKPNIMGMIIGKALYTDAVKLPDAIKAAE